MMVIPLSQSQRKVVETIYPPAAGHLVYIAQDSAFPGHSLLFKFIFWHQGGEVVTQCVCEVQTMYKESVLSLHHMGSRNRTHITNE